MSEPATPTGPDSGDMTPPPVDPEPLHLEDLLSSPDTVTAAPPPPPAVADREPQAGGVTVAVQSAPQAPIRTGWRARMASWASSVQVEEMPAADAQEIQAGQEESIAAARWSRPVNVAVLNVKGGSGKTPTALALAGILAHVRGGGVVVLEACETQGTLAARAEGAAQGGLAGLLERAGEIPNAVALSAYMLRQSSHADVLANWDRPGRVIAAEDVLAARTVTDHYFTVSVTDTSINPASGPWQAAVATADVAVLPVTFSSDSLAGAARVLEYLRAAGPEYSDPETGLVARTLVVLTDSGIRTAPGVAEGIREAAAGLGVPVLSVPFDPALQDGKIHLGSLSESSRVAWTAVTAAVVDLCGRADLAVNLVERASGQSAS